MNTITSHLHRTSKPTKFIPTTSMTPPMATRSRSSSVSSDFSDSDEAYFSRTYVPLSNLPTPPLSSHSNASSRQQSSDSFFSHDEYLEPELLGPAIHLTNLIPSSTSLTPASTPLIHALLTRASLPLETIAFSVSILDSLNSRFALQWRKSCPLNTSSSSYSNFQDQHIDSVPPEIIPLSALILAVKFLDDAQESTREYVNGWGKGIWSCEQVNFTQWCLLENLGYRLLPLWEEGVILGALEDMKRAGRQFEPRIVEQEWDEALGCGTLGYIVDSGQEGMGEQLTPADTPLVENVRGAKEDYFMLADRMVTTSSPKEPWPLYVDLGNQLGF